MPRTKKSDSNVFVFEPEKIDIDVDPEKAIRREKVLKEMEKRRDKRSIKKPVIDDYRDTLGGRKLVYKKFKEGADFLTGQPSDMVAMVRLAKESCRAQTGGSAYFETVEDLQEAIETYWEYILQANEKGNLIYPDVEGLAMYLGVSRERMLEWERTNFRGFREVLSTAKNAIAACKKQMALQSKIPAIVFATDFNNNHGYVQKQQIEAAVFAPMGDDKSLKELEGKVADIVFDGDMMTKPFE